MSPLERSSQLRFLAGAPMINAQNLSLGDESGAYVLRRRLLQSLKSDDWATCRESLADNDANGFGFDHRPGFFATICLVLTYGLELQRFGDIAQAERWPLGA